MKTTAFAIYSILTICSFSCTKLHAQSNVHNTIKGNPLIQELLVLKTKMTENNALGDRFKIQLTYTGNLNEANEIKSKFDRLYDQWPSFIKFETPNYKVWVGDFRNRLEAERAFVKIKNDFKSAFIFKPDGF